jgi:hypothetical protein
MQNELVQSVMKKIDLIHSFAKMLYRILEKLTAKNMFMKVYHDLIESAPLASILVRVFGIGVQIPNSPNNNSVINITGLQQLDNLINQLKTKALECINYFLKKQDKTCKYITQKGGNQVLIGLTNLVPLMIQSLIIFGQRTDIENLLDETTISNFIEEALENLSLTTSFDQFKDIFFRYLPNLILDVGLTLIKTTESERQDMYDKPQDFVNLALDTCDKQQSGIVKT